MFTLDLLKVFYRNILKLTDVTKDMNGNYIGSYIFEIINSDK